MLSTDRLIAVINSSIYFQEFLEATLASTVVMMKQHPQIEHITSQRIDCVNPSNIISCSLPLMPFFLTEGVAQWHVNVLGQDSSVEGSPKSLLFSSTEFEECS